MSDAIYWCLIFSTSVRKPLHYRKQVGLPFAWCAEGCTRIAGHTPKVSYTHSGQITRLKQGSDQQHFARTGTAPTCWWRAWAPAQSPARQWAAPSRQRCPAPRGWRWPRPPAAPAPRPGPWTSPTCHPAAPLASYQAPTLGTFIRTLRLAHATS